MEIQNTAYRTALESIEALLSNPKIKGEIFDDIVDVKTRLEESEIDGVAAMKELINLIENC